MPEMSLSPRQAAFVKNISKGHNQSESAILAGYSAKSADVIGSRLIRNSKVIKALDLVGLTDTRIAQGIKDNADAGDGVKATADTALRAYELASRLKGYLDKEPEPSNLTQNNIYIQELKALDTASLNSKLNAILADIEALK